MTNSTNPDLPTMHIPIVVFEKRKKKSKAIHVTKV